MTRCPHPDCDRTIGREMFACRGHWYSLPSELRRRIWRNYADGTATAIVDSYQGAADFWGCTLAEVMS